MLYLELEFAKLSYSRSTLSRDLHAHPAFAGILRRRKGTDKKLRDLYETDHPHDSWQLDAKGPFPVTLINGKTIRVHVLSILDDFSRYILAAIIAAGREYRGGREGFSFGRIQVGYGRAHAVRPCFGL